MEVGKWIRIQRQKLHISQSALGKLLCLSPSTISKWECNAQSPTLEHVRELERIFGAQAPDQDCAYYGYDAGMEVEIRYNRNAAKADRCLNTVARLFLDLGQQLFKDPAVQAEFAAWQAKRAAKEAAAYGQN